MRTLANYHFGGRGKRGGGWGEDGWEEGWMEGGVELEDVREVEEIDWRGEGGGGGLNLI